MSDTAIAPAEIGRRFQLHRPDVATAELMDEVRGEVIALAEFINVRLPAGREASLAFTKLEESLFHAISALARGDAADR